MTPPRKRIIALLAFLACFSIPSIPRSNAQPLGTHVDYPAGTQPLDVAVADFNLDGKPDIALLSQQDTLSIFLGTGGGVFGPRTTFPGNHPGITEAYGAIAAGDLNNDGKPDIAVAIHNQSYIRLGQGNGSFGSPILYPTGGGLGVFGRDLALGDFNNDGKLDMVALSDASSDWVAYHGNGDGTFSTSSAGSGYILGGLTIGDFNRDGKLDFALGNQPGFSSTGEIAVHLGNGDGTFGSALISTVNGESDAWSIGTGDFTRDGIPDIAVGSSNSLHVTIMAGVGDGTFTHSFGSAGTFPSLTDLAVADVTNDGLLDVVTAHSGDHISVFPGDGTGMLPSRVDITSGTAPRGLAVADLNSDIDRDVAVAANGGKLSVHLNTGIAQVNVDQSFFVPQSGSVSSPTEGASAIRFFRACPNNDAGSSLPFNARIKIVLRDSHGNPMIGIPAGNLCVQFNGGTEAQGFMGTGADSIIANGTYNVTPLCPNVLCLSADAATDVAGTTYITFTGSTPGSPGVGTRDPNRKWGHYDSSIPVRYLGLRLDGRLTSASANGTYTLILKNYDFVLGLGTAMNQGEVVSSSDFNSLAAALGHSVSENPLYYWRDFDNDGQVGSTDYNAFTTHIAHNCDTPNP